MKTHVGVDAGSGYVHTIEANSANKHDITVASKLIRKDDKVVYGDSGYVGIQKCSEIQADEQKGAIDYCVNQRPGKISKIPDRPEKGWDRRIEYQKSAVRCRVDYSFPHRKGIFGYRKQFIEGLPRISIDFTCYLEAQIC